MTWQAQEKEIAVTMRRGHTVLYKFDDVSRARGPLRTLLGEILLHHTLPLRTVHRQIKQLEDVHITLPRGVLRLYDLDLQRRPLHLRVDDTAYER